MSRICGVISPNLNKQAIKVMLQKMTKSMQHEPWHRIDEWSENVIGLGHTSIGAVNEEMQPIFNNGKLIISAGKIFAYGDRKRELVEKGYRFNYPANDAEFVLNLHGEYGTHKFNQLNGIFAFSIWDKTKKELILVNDRYGMRPLYYYYDDSKKLLMFASQIKAISCQPIFNKKVNWDAWNIFLRLGFLLGEETFFKNLHVLPQGSILHFDLNKVTIKNYWNYHSLKTKNNFDEDEDINNLVFLFKQSMKRRIIPGKKIAAFLSGGLDSSGIAAELKCQNATFISYTTRKFSPIDKDRKTAAEIAKILGIQNEFCDLPDEFLEKFEDRRNHLLDYESDEHAWLLPLVDSLPSDTKINFDGIAQDVMCDPRLYQEDNQEYRKLFEEKEYNEFINSWFHLKMWSFLKWDTKKNKGNLIFFSRKLRENFSNERFILKVKEEMKKYEKNSNQYILFHLANRARREVALAPFQLILNKLESFCPYLDNDYFEYLMSLPVGARKNGTLRTKILSNAYPELFNKNGLSKEVVHEEYRGQSLKYLTKIEISLFKNIRFDIFNAPYLIPRICFDFAVKLKTALKRERLPRDPFGYCHHWLMPALSFLNNWSLSESIRKKDL